MNVDSRAGKSDDKLDNIQLLRAVAAVMVAFAHIDHLGIFDPKIISPGYTPTSFISFSSGVDIFFIISGFIITISSRKSIDIKAFISKRATRIIPLYWSVLTAFIILKLLKIFILNTSDQNGKMNFLSIFTSYFFIPYDSMGYGKSYPFPLLDLGWTLNFEVFFYLIFALCMMAGSKHLVGLLIAGLLACVTLGQVAPDLPLPFSFWFQPIILEFLAGLVLALIYRAGVRLNPAVQIAFIIAGLLIWIFLRESSFVVIPSDAKGSYSWPRILSGGAGALCIMIGAALSKKQVTGIVARIGNALGASSYALYLTHVFTIIAVQIALKALPFPIDWHLQYTIFLLLIAIAVAHAVHLWFEKPVTKILNAHLRARLRPTHDQFS